VSVAPTLSELLNGTPVCRWVIGYGAVINMRKGKRLQKMGGSCYGLENK